MKRIIALTLAVLIVFGMTACSNGGGNQETTEETEYTGYMVPQTMEKPVYTVSENPTTRELREVAVKAMRDMLSIQWSTPKDFMYNKEGAVSNKDYRYYINTTYAGLPYADAQTNIYVWYEYYDPKTGVLNMEGDGQWLNDTLGNTCAGSLMWGWSVVCDSLTGKYVNTQMVSKYGCIPVGDYTYNTYISSYYEQSTEEICSLNGMNKIMECYALMQMADAVTSSTAAHTMMAIEDATVVRTADGQIDPSQSYIVIQDQAAGTGDKFYEVSDEQGNILHYTGRTEKKFTFMELYNQDYIPVTTAELAGLEPYTKPEVKFSLENCTTVSDMLTGAFTSNYPMCMMKLNATDKDGKVINLHTIYFDREDVAEGKARDYRISGDRMAIEAALEALESGTYTITAEVTASTGDVFTPVSFEYKK